MKLKLTRVIKNVSKAEIRVISITILQDLKFCLIAVTTAHIGRRNDYLNLVFCRLKIY